MVDSEACCSSVSSRTVYYHNEGASAVKVTCRSSRARRPQGATLQLAQ